MLQRYLIIETYPTHSYIRIWYYDPKALAILTQLRVGLSKLNFHKFRHNFRDTINPLYPTNDGVEDTEHFLLFCHSYDGPRSDPLNSANAILLPNGFSSLQMKSYSNSL